MITKLLLRFTMFVTKELIAIVSFILCSVEVRSTHVYRFVTGNPSTLNVSKEFEVNLHHSATEEFSLP
jgi:hypothetical protein